MSLLYVNNNGQVTPNNLPTISFGNRGHLYGDGVFESIRVINGKITNLENHWLRLTEGAKVLKMGKKRAKIIAFPPYLSKKSLD